MRETDVWRNATEAEFDNAMEGMEKLVMNRLYDLYVAQFIPVKSSLSKSRRHAQHAVHLPHRWLVWFPHGLLQPMT